MSSASPNKRFIAANGIRMKVLSWPSPAGSATPAVLLHGLTSCAETWSLVAPTLAQRRPVYALDLRGHGETDKPDDGYDPETVVNDIAGALDALGIAACSVAGHSWGCSLGARLAARHPDRVRRLALVDGGLGFGRGGEPPTPERLEQMLAPIEIYQSVDTYLAEVRRGLNGYWTPEVEEIALASIYHNEDGSVRERLSRDNQKQILAGGWGQDVSALYARIICPVLIVPAERATAGPEQRAARRAAVAEAATRLPNASVCWVPETVHDIQLHRPAVLASLLDKHFE